MFILDEFDDLPLIIKKRFVESVLADQNSCDFNDPNQFPDYDEFLMDDLHEGI